MDKDTTGMSLPSTGAQGTERVMRARRSDGTYEVDGERDVGMISCPDCGGAIVLTQEVTAFDPATGAVTAWGPDMGECARCGVTLVDQGDGLRALRLNP